MRSVHRAPTTSQGHPRAHPQVQPRARARAAQMPHPDEAPCFKRAAAGFLASCAAVYALALAMAMVA
ncbi:hypothetical protein [Salinarimonas sp.]|uniref:hypothetical protein n=1 Tax=Salinarimonas sp. TaxID=2766526 RepID=UPI0032D9A9BD